MDKQWVDVLWRLTKGDALQLRALNEMDVFEFFNILEANKKLKNG